jgi:hypothetical protein
MQLCKQGLAAGFTAAKLISPPSLVSCSLLGLIYRPAGRRSVRHGAIFGNTFKMICPVQPCRQKDSGFDLTRLTSRTAAVPTRQEGRIARRHERGMGCGGRGSVGAQVCSQGGFRWLRTAKPCGPDTRCWCQAVGGDIDPTGSVSAIKPAATATRRIRSPGRARHKPSNHRAGNAGLPPLNLYARVRFFAHSCTRDRGCSAHPAFPAPSLLGGRMLTQNSGKPCRENANSYPLFEN